MLETFAYKKYKKYKLTKELREANAKEALSKHDEAFIRRSIDNGKQATPSTSMFKFLQKRKSTIDTVPPTTEELIAVKSEDEGIVSGS